MVKIDFNRDYYGDLEMSSNADIEAIKKQYRKLALKLHPDRNKESDAAQKFQTIQAAYEVLTSPEQKARYDNSRKSRYSAASGVKGNPWQDISKNYPPPPRPPGFPPRPTPRPTPKRQPSTSGADKYADFAASAPPPNSARRGHKPPESTWTWRAWEQMKPGTDAKPTSDYTAGTGASQRASSNVKSSGSARPPPVPPRADPQKQPKGSFGNRINRGYTPQSPSGDEPPVANNNYFTNRTHTNLFSETSSAARSRRRAPSNPDPTADSRGSTFVDARKRTPYQTRGGEKLDPWNGASNIGRSRSTRETSRGPYHDDRETSPTPSARQRSASVPDDPDDISQAKQDGRGDLNGGNMDTTQGSNAGGHSTEPNADEAKGKDGSKLYANQPHCTFRSVYQAPLKAQQATGRAGDEEPFKKKTLNLSPELHELLVRQSSSGDPPKSYHGLNAFDHKMHQVLSGLSAVIYSSRVLGKQSGGVQDAAHPHMTSQQKNGADNGNDNSFNLKFAGDSITPDPHRFTRNSADNINTRFVAEEDAATDWQFNAGSPVNENGRPPMPRSKSGSRIGRKSPFRPQASQSPFAESENGDVPPQNDSFNPEEWSEKIGPQNFQTPGMQQGQKASMPTTRPIRNPSKKSKSVRMTAGTAGMVDSDESSGIPEDISQKPSVSGNANGVARSASPNAMDIDSPPVSLDANGVRNIPVEPSRPEWRAGNTKGIKADAKALADQQTEFVPPAGGSEDTEEFRTSFSDFRNVEPFAERATGLESFGDLKSNLPFPSTASGSVPIEKPASKPVKLHLPEPPKPPHPPAALGVNALKPTLEAWKKHVDDFYIYLTEWHHFNTKFTDHFAARALQVQEKLVKPAWLESRDRTGVQEYLQWTAEDREVRAQWTEACNNHEIHIRRFATHRDKMMK